MVGPIHVMCAVDPGPNMVTVDLYSANVAVVQEDRGNTRAVCRCDGICCELGPQVVSEATLYRPLFFGYARCFCPRQVGRAVVANSLLDSGVGRNWPKREDRPEWSHLGFGLGLCRGRRLIV